MNVDQIEELKLNRILDAPRELVFKAWTDPVELAKWWGPTGFSAPFCELDARPGGAIVIHMQAPDGSINPIGGRFLEVEEPSRVVFISTGFKDADGNNMIEMLNTVTLTEQDGKTHLQLVVKALVVADAMAEAIGGQTEGWNLSLDKLEALYR